MTRKEQIESIEKQLKEGVSTFFTSERYADLLKVMSHFHTYSFNNSLLIAMQCPNASYVAGYTTWRTLNRYVMKGAKSIKIISPCPYRKINAETGEIEKEMLLFKTASVFDISQTEAIPNTSQVELGLKNLEGTVPDYDRKIAAIISALTVPVSYEEIHGGARGYYVPAEDRIVICADMSPLQTLKTLIHEGAHSILHNPGQMKVRQVDRESKEVEAESVAYMVSAMLGLDTSEYSFEYIASWEGKDDLKKLNHSMNLIRKTATNLYDSILANLQ